MRIDEEIFGLRFNIRKDILERWCNDYGYRDIDEFKKKSNLKTAYLIYINSYCQRRW